MQGNTVVELREATVLRQGRAVLDRVSLSIREGEHTALVGPNGSGKSSLVKLLTHEHYPVAPADGSAPVRVFGCERWNVAELRTHLGIVSADLQYQLVHGTSMGHLRGLEAVVSGFFASQVIFLHHELTDEMRARAAEALARIGAARLALQPVHTMSTGELRRVLIARALVTEPRALLLDEPTTGLDLVARREFLTRLRSLATRDLTILLVTHQVEEILPEIERVILLKEGRVAHDGPKRDILTSANLTDAFATPVAVREQDGFYSLKLG